MSDLVGSQLGDYILKKRFASGGMAEIYLGEDVQLGRRAAIKVLSPDTTRSDKSLSTRFEREARAIASLEHDNIVPIYQFGKQDSLYFLAMRYIEGSDLADEIHRYHVIGDFMPIERALNILGQVAAALDYAHQHGIIHRDVKPSNVLLGADDKAILTDFGLVLWQSVDQTYGTAFGTPRYISPEQATDSQSVVPQSDVYSLAVIAYEIVTGAHLFTGATPMEVALAHVTDDPVPPSQLNPAVPYQAEQEILRSLSKTPERRHQTATELINALKRAYNLQPTNVQAGAAAESDPKILSEWDDSPTIMDVGKHANEPPPQRKRQAIPSPKPRTLFDRTILEMSSARTGVAFGALAVVIAILLGLGIIGGGTLFAPSSGEAQPTATLAAFNVVADATLTPTETLIPATATNTPITPTQTPTATQTDTQSSPTPVPTTPVVVPTTPAIATQPDAANAQPASVPLLQARYDERTLVLINPSEEASVPLGGLRFRGQGDDASSTLELGSDLPPLACVAIKTESSIIPAAWGCTPLREVVLGGNDFFWRAGSDADQTFTVWLDETEVAICLTVGRAVNRLDDENCTITLRADS